VTALRPIVETAVGTRISRTSQKANGIQPPVGRVHGPNSGSGTHLGLGFGVVFSELPSCAVETGTPKSRNSAESQVPRP
jgi:hypothetical protein